MSMGFIYSTHFLNFTGTKKKTNPGTQIYTSHRLVQCDDVSICPQSHLKQDSQVDIKYTSENHHFPDAVNIHYIRRSVATFCSFCALGKHILQISTPLKPLMFEKLLLLQ